ncbi:S9 family peptidase [Paenibacillus sp. MER TA 81-3]|uniref:alpha/beta hydrolase family protein n=1 Tax=Paenibacillus sp. MER TA 81-3 TaxID=2939573 RepID=UPI00203A8EA5|nr:S9 family peptidase [Paenibacillus sp. MER TA 81-3]MCM3339848.1 S9 family peptidase [Paenibacillus sp. MER TA 81-3]
MIKRRITAEDLYRFTWISDPAVRPAGGTIAYVSKTVKEDKSGYRSRILLTDWNGSATREFTRGEQDAAPAWSPDGSKLAFLRKDGQKNQVWFIDAEGGEAYAVTKAEEGVSAFAWSPDGQSLLYTSKADPDKQAKGDDATAEQDDLPKPGKQAIVVDRTKSKADGSGLWDSKRVHLFVHDIESTQDTAITSGDFDVIDFTWSPNGDEIVFAAKIPTDASVDADLVLTNDLFIAGRSGGEFRRLTKTAMSVSKPVFSPDGSSIAFFGDERSHGNATTTQIYTAAYPDGEIKCLTGRLDLHMGNAAVTDMKMGASSGPVFSRDGQSIYALVTTEGNVHVGRFGVDGSHEMLTSGPREIIQIAYAGSGNELVLVAADTQRPGELYRLHAESKQEVQLTRSNAALLEELELSKPESFWFEASDGGKVQGWILPPVGLETGKKAATILEIHGGPHAMYVNSFMHEFQLLAAQGYAVIYCNPRGGHGYGQEFVNTCRGDYGGRDYLDVIELVDYAVSHYSYVDEQRLGVTGGSYGGFMTNWIVGHTNRFKAAVTQRSICNWLSFYGVSDIGYFFTEDQIGGQPWEEPEKLWKHSPLAYVKQVETPLLILHGEEDLRCPIEQAEQLYVALKRLGKKTQLVRFPGANHDLSRSGHPELRVERLNRIAGWMNGVFQA